jgi:hypothetical protein
VIAVAVKATNQLTAIGVATRDRYVLEGHVKDVDHVPASENGGAQDRGCPPYPAASFTASSSRRERSRSSARPRIGAKQNQDARAIEVNISRGAARPAHQDGCR